MLLIFSLQLSTTRGVWITATMQPRSAVTWTGIPNSFGKWEWSWHFSGVWWRMKSRLFSRSSYSLLKPAFSICNYVFEVSGRASLKVNGVVLTIGLWLDQGFASPLVQGIDFRVQDIEYKFSLVRQDLTREVKYACFHFAHFTAFPTMFSRSKYHC